MGIGGAIAYAAGALLLAAVLHGVRPRPAWSIPGGAALAFLVAIAFTHGGPLRDLAVAAGGIGLGAATALVAVGGARRLARRRPRPLPAGAPAARLWRGQLPVYLGVVSLAAWLLAIVWLSAALSQIERQAVPRLLALVTLTLWVLGPAGTAVALVGIWRSLARGAPRAPPRPVAWLLRLALAVAWLLWVVVVIEFGRPHVLESASLTFGPAETTRYRLRLLRQGRELEFSGGIRLGANADVEKVLDAHPEVRLLHLDSEGGWSGEAARLARLVRRRRLTTYVANRCDSACVLVLAAGEQRLLSRSAQIGLHRPRSAGETEADRRRSQEQLVAALVEAGVERSFAERGAGVPQQAIWRPAHAEIFAAGLATGWARPDEVALSGVGAEELERLPLLMRRRAFFQALFEFERPYFETWVAAVRAGYERGQSLPEALEPVGAGLQTVIDRVMSQDIPRAPDRAVRRFFQASLAIEREARQRDPRHCAAILQGRFVGAVARGPNDASDEYGEALAALMASARIDPVEPQAVTPGNRALAAAVARVEKRHPGSLELAADLEALAKGPQDVACRVLDAGLELIDALLRLPAAEGTPALRALASSGSGPAQVAP